MEIKIEEIKDLLENKKFNSLKDKLNQINAADIPAILEELDKESVIKVFRILSKEQAGETFTYMDSDMKEKLIQDLTDAELKNVMDELFMDDTVDLVEEMPANTTGGKKPHRNSILNVKVVWEPSQSTLLFWQYSLRNW